MIHLLTQGDLTLSVSMVLTVIVGVFLGSFMDAIAGGGGIITVPTYVLAGLPMHMALGTNKLSASIGTVASAGKFMRSGYVQWRFALPAIAAALIGASLGTQLQLRVDAVYLQYLLLLVLPIVAFVVLRQRTFPEEPTPMAFQKQLIIVVLSAFFIGGYDGFYGPGTGTFLLLIFTRWGGMDVRSASGQARTINLASNIGAVFTSLYYGQVFYILGLLGAIVAFAGHACGAELALRKGSGIVRPTTLVVLGLLVVKVLTELV